MPHLLNDFSKTNYFNVRSYVNFLFLNFQKAINIIKIISFCKGCLVKEEGLQILQAITSYEKCPYCRF